MVMFNRRFVSFRDDFGGLFETVFQIAPTRVGWITGVDRRGFVSGSGVFIKINFRFFGFVRNLDEIGCVPRLLVSFGNDQTDILPVAVDFRVL